MKKIILFAACIAFLPPLARAETVAPIDTAARQAFLLDASTGTPLYNKNGDERMTPSSMAKMMTMYLTFEALKNGKLTLDKELITSKHAWDQTRKEGGSSMFLNVGQQARVEDLIRGTVIQSGNDAAIVLAETLGGSEPAFADMMNAKARELGLTNTHFVNATGIPDPDQYSTAHDLAVLALALIRDYPEYYHYFSEMSFKFNNIDQGNRNPLLYRKMDVDGLKTGHTDDGGYGLTASALRNKRRLIVVINGTATMQARADESAKVLEWGYREYGSYAIVNAGDHMTDVKVWLGEAPTVPLMTAQPVLLTLPRTSRVGLKADISYDQPLPAPIAKGEPIGILTITAPGMEKKTYPLIAGADVPMVGFMQRVEAKLNVFLGRT